MHPCSLTCIHVASCANHSPVWLELYFATPILEPPLPSQRLLLYINNHYLLHEVIRPLVRDAIGTLVIQLLHDVDTAWYRFVQRMQMLIVVYGLSMNPD